MKKLLTAALVGAATLALLTGCTPATVKQMPTATPSASTVPAATKAPSDLLPKNEASKQSPKLLATVTLRQGVVLKAYKVGSGTVVSEQLKANPLFNTEHIKTGNKVAVVRYTLTNSSGKTIPVDTFTYNGVFVGGNGKAAVADNGYASAAARLGFTTTPVAQFTNTKTGQAGNWPLKSGASADWYTDWALEAKGVLLQNFSLDGKTVNNVRANLS